MSQFNERDAAAQVDDVDGLARSLNLVARELGLTAPLVTSTGTAPNRTFTVNDSVAGFIQQNARKTGRARAAAQPAAPVVDNHGWE